MNAIAPVTTLSNEDVVFLSTVAEKLYKSGALPAQLNNPEKVFMVLLAGRDLGLQPTQAINGLYIVNGKITIYGETAAILMKRAGYEIKRETMTSKEATVTIRHKDNPDNKHTEKYTIEMADHAGITTGGMGIRKKYPQIMLRRKALAFARKFFAPEALGGYLIKEEIEGEVENKSEIVTIDEVVDGFTPIIAEDGNN